jgi:hypothetical protein
MKEVLDEFGAALVAARDEAIGVVDRFLAGEDPSDRGMTLRERLGGGISPEAARTYRAIAIDAIDETLHQVLWLFERSEQFDITARLESGEILSLRDASDGLAGELYTEDGWLARFSRFGGR